MTDLDPAAFDQLLPVASAAIDAHGEDGMSTYKFLAGAIREIYRHVEFDNFKEGLTVVARVGSWNPRDIKSTIAKLPLSADPIFTADHPWLVNLDISTPTIAEGGGLDCDENAICYVFDADGERFRIAGKDHDVPRLLPALPSQYAASSFLDLAACIDHYGRTMIRRSRCRVFNDVWRDSKRLMFKPKPESTMRRSLQQYLTGALRGFDSIEVRPEQNMDETHPVDLKITFMGSLKQAILEIKWLGKGETKTGNELNYTPSRANDGAKQLKNYLEDNKDSITGIESRGTLIVFDGRRRNVSLTKTSVTYPDGLHYELRDITYDPEFHGLVPGFEKPFRLFAEPVCDP